MAETETVTLFRPVGDDELELIRASGYTDFNRDIVGTIEVVAGFAAPGK